MTATSPAAMLNGQAQWPIAMAFPDNFHLLHQGEEGVRQLSIAAIGVDTGLSLHAGAVEAAMTALDHFTRGYQTEDQDQLIIQLLGIRLFNGAATTLKQLLSGYYQVTVSSVRDVLETANLVDYFTIDRSLVSKWRTADDKERWKQFKPAVVRDALSRRDGGNAKKNRVSIYSALSSYGTHPSPKGFRMLRREPNGLAQIGPFFELLTLKALLAELAKTVVPSGMHVIRNFEIRTQLDHLTAIGYLDMSDRWSAYFFGTPYMPVKFSKLRFLAHLASR